MIQRQHINQHTVAETIARHAENTWNRNENVMLVVGATSISDLSDIRSSAPSIPFLVPGVGHQGGDPERVMRIGTRASGDGLVVAASRSVLYAGDAEKIREEAEKLNKTVNIHAKIIYVRTTNKTKFLDDCQYRSNTPQKRRLKGEGKRLRSAALCADRAVLGDWNEGHGCPESP